MEFNVQKCAVLSITRKRKPSHHQYSIFGQPLANVDQHDHLGITIASDLRWNSHCNNVIKKSNKTLCLLRRTLALCSKDVKTKAYESLIRPGLEYASEAWCPHTSSLVDKIEQVQRAAARFMHSDYRWATRVTSLINNLGWDSLHVRHLLAQNVEQTFLGIVFLLIRYQFVHSCPKELGLNIKEHCPKNSVELAEIADRYIDAHKSWWPFSKSKNRDNNKGKPKYNPQSGGQGNQSNFRQ